MAEKTGRREKPIDPRAPYANFAYGLRALKDKSGKTYREISRKGYYSPAALCAAASGKVLPSLDVTLAFIVPCDGSKDEWTAIWNKEAQRGRLQ